jgi:hypothetical protein
MKVYQYNTESGVYAGELFEDSVSIQYCEGVTTTPPPQYGAGQLPVFDMVRNKWELLPTETVRQLLQIKTKGTS